MRPADLLRQNNHQKTAQKISHPRAQKNPHRAHQRGEDLKGKPDHHASIFWLVTCDAYLQATGMPIRSETKPNAKKSDMFKKKIATTYTGMKIAIVAAAPDGV